MYAPFVNSSWMVAQDFRIREIENCFKTERSDNFVGVHGN